VCERCATECVLPLSAIRAVNEFKACGRCYICPAYFKITSAVGPDGLPTEKVCPRDAIKREAIGWIERYVGEKIGTKADRPGMDFVASGDPTQQDCLDEATNTTSYLKFLANHDLIKHHTVAAPFAKENYLRGISGWTHWTAVLKEKETGTRWAVDSWIQGNGVNPAIVEADKWYITDLEDLPGATL